MRRALTPVLIVVSLATAGAAFTQSLTSSLGLSKGPEQPVHFSHKIHAGKLNMDCLYCHFAADKSPIANIPPVSLCMGCHKIAATDKPEIQKLTDYYNRHQVVPWVEVYKLPQHVKFNHKRHVLADVACTTCHGPVPEMDVIYEYPSMKMGWCITCHRQKLNDPKYPASMDCVICHH